MNLDKHVENAQIFIKELAKELGHPADTDRAWRVLRTTFHVLRRRLTVEESFDLVAELPMLMKALYVDGWNPSREQSRIKSPEDFVTAMVSTHGRAATGDLPTQATAEDAALAVFRVIQNHISLGESENIKSILPRELKEFWMPQA